MSTERKLTEPDADAALRQSIRASLFHYAGSPDATGMDRTRLNDAQKDVVVGIVLRVFKTNTRTELEAIAAEIDQQRAQKKMITAVPARNSITTAYLNQSKEQPESEVINAIKPRLAEGLASVTFYPDPQTREAGACAESVMQSINRKGMPVVVKGGYL